MYSPPNQRTSVPLANGQMRFFRHRLLVYILPGIFVSVEGKGLRIVSPGTIFTISQPVTILWHEDDIRHNGLVFKLVQDSQPSGIEVKIPIATIAEDDSDHGTFTFAPRVPGYFALLGFEIEDGNEG
ncbi:hypothetical protein PQX77_007346 [Marasmius sp. AFHP31]|nr:hypothetical protein PQX77_007346 [Marasmius sp. AFHP31]